MKVASMLRSKHKNMTKFITSLVLIAIIMTAQIQTVFAAPASQELAPITSTVQRITLKSDPNTGVTLVLVDVLNIDQELRTVRISLKTALGLGLVVLDGDGMPIINLSALVQPIEINPTTLIPDEDKNQHPVGSALATFFSNIAGVDYDTIMSAHEEGVGFGVIAQALWFTKELNGDSTVFEALLLAKEMGDFEDFAIVDDEDGTITTPKSWGQLRKAILDGKKVSNPGSVISDKGNDNSNGNTNGNGGGNGNGKDKNKGNNGNGNGNGKGNGNNR